MNNESVNEKVESGYMHSDLRERILKCLQASEYWTEKSRISIHGKIFPLKCPDCHKANAWAYADDPFSVNCNHLKNCGARTKTLELFPEVIRSIEKDHPPTETDPNAPATYYLHSRGLSKALAGLAYRYAKDIRKSGSGGVLFPVLNREGKTIENGRLFNPPKGTDKSHNIGSTSGAVWKHPAYDYEPGKETYVTESIINALSFLAMGMQAVSVLSAGNDPAKCDLSAYPRPVFAFDNDEAGHGALKKWKQAYPHAGAVLPTFGDWNDFLQHSGPGHAAKAFEDRRKEFDFNAELALCENAEAYAKKYQEFKGFSPGLFAFDGEYHYANKDNEVRKLSNFVLSVEHYRLDTSNPEYPVYRYQLKVKPKKERERSFVVSANEIASEQAMRTMFLSRANVLWEGGKTETGKLLSLITKSKAPVIRALEIKGYDRESGTYVFQNFMIDKSGRFIAANGEGFYSAGREYVRAAPYPDILPSKGTDPAKIFDLLTTAWDERAAVALAWVTASWFVNEIKEKLTFFPFLSLYGDPQTGKSNLTRFLNMIQGIDGEEGIDTKKMTYKAVIRKLSQRSGLFQALLEGDRHSKSKFDYRNILTLFNRGVPLSSNAMFSNDNQTRDYPFLASILFVQNREPFASREEKERVVSLHFKDDDMTDASRQAFETIDGIPAEEMAWFYVHIMEKHNEIRKIWHDSYVKAKADLRGTVKNSRICECHSLVLAFYRIICERIGIDHAKFDIVPFLSEIAQKKMQECRQEELTLADLFLQIMTDCTDAKAVVIKEKSRQLCVYMPNAIGIAKAAGLNITEDLTDKLKNHAAYAGQKPVRFPEIDPDKPVKNAWAFKLDKISDRGCILPPDSEDE